MGNQCRLIHVLVLLTGLGSSAAACSRDPDGRQQLLAADGRDQARRQRAESKRALSPEGELLPSETKLGGIVMPRGYEPKFEEKHAWTYDAEVPVATARRYFERRLTTSSIQEKPLGEIVFLGAREKSDPNMPAALVKVMPMPTRPAGSRIYVAEPVPVAELPPLEENDDIVRARLAERRKNAR
jgi:hypothetical protein